MADITSFPSDLIARSMSGKSATNVKDQERGDFVISWKETWFGMATQSGRRRYMIYVGVLGQGVVKYMCLGAAL